MLGIYAVISARASGSKITKEVISAFDLLRQIHPVLQYLVVYLPCTPYSGTQPLLSTQYLRHLGRLHQES